MRSGFKLKSRNTLALAVSTALFGVGTVVSAAPVLEEIIVTAQKREQTLQDVPVAVSAFSGDFIAKADIRDIRGLVDLTPGFYGRTEDSFVDALSIRGIVTNDYGIGGDPSIPVFTDGVWQGRNGGVQMNFYDIERVEVVKGPQATLFGRNAIAGAVSIITNKPIDEFEGRIDGGIAEYDHFDVHGMVNIPLSDRWYYRGNIQGLSEDGYLENLAGGDDLGYHQQVSTRHSLRYSGDALDAIFTMTYEDREQDPSVYWDPTLGLDKNRVNIDLGDKGFDKSEIFGFTANVQWDLNENYSVSSITGYKTYKFDYLEDYDARPEYIDHFHQKNDVDYYSQELRLNFSGERVNWFVGAAVYDETVDGYFETRYSESDLCRAIARTETDDFDGPVSGCTDPLFEAYWGSPIDPTLLDENKSEASWNDVESKGYSIYSDMTWSVTGKLDLTLGARWSYDEKDMRTRVGNSGGALGNNVTWEFHTGGYVGDNANWDKFTPRAALTYELNEQVSLYANVSTGYKSGGFATFGITVPDADGDGLPDITDSGQVSAASVPTVFDPETSTSYEIGAKTRLLADTLQLNMAYFRYTYEDLQLLYFDSGSSLVANLGEAENQGVEVDARWLIGDHFEAFMAGSWMDSEITDAREMIAKGVCSNCDGKNMPFAPDWSAALHLTWTYPMFCGDVFAKSEVSYQDTMYSDLDNIPNIAVDSWQEWNFRVGYDDAAEWGVTLYVENAFDEEYFERGWANANTANTGGYGLTNTLVWPAKPRTFGASAYMNF